LGFFSALASLFFAALKTSAHCAGERKKVCGGDGEHKNLCKWHKFQVKSFMSGWRISRASLTLPLCSALFRRPHLSFVFSPFASLCAVLCWEIGLTIIKMMTSLRAYSCLLQVYEFVTGMRKKTRRGAI
jgi:hypothetical protein